MDNTLKINSGFWSYRKGELHCEEVPLSRIAAEFSTPTYVYSRGHLEERFREIDRCWKRPHLICYSLKSNSSLAVASVLARLGAGADVVSGGELRRAMAAGIPAQRIVFAGVGKTDSEIRAALRARILYFTVESDPEAERINALAGRMKTAAPVAARVTPDVDPKTHRYITTSKPENKFGLDLEAALDFYRGLKRLPNLNPVGIQMHIGSQILRVDPYREAVGKLAAAVRELAREGMRLAYFDIGGGWGSATGARKPPRPPLTPGRFRRPWAAWKRRSCWNRAATSPATPVASWGERYISSARRKRTSSSSTPG